MRRLKRFVVLALLSAFLLPAIGLTLGGCDNDHRHHHATEVPLPR